MTGQVDGHQGTAQRHRYRVPRVRVLATAVEEHQLRVAGPPHQRTQPAAIPDLHELAPHRWRAVERQPVLLCVFVKQPELVVLDPLYPTHRLLLPIRTAVSWTLRGSPGRDNRDGGCEAPPTSCSSARRSTRAQQT